jgi:hypothetical protein
MAMRTVNPGLGLVLLAQGLLFGGLWLVDHRRPPAQRHTGRVEACLALVCLLGALYYLGRWVALR